MWLYVLTAVFGAVIASLWAIRRSRSTHARPMLAGGHWLWGHAQFFAPIETLHERLIALARDGPRAVWLRIGPAGPLGADVLMINDAALAASLLRMGASRIQQDPAAVDDIARVIGTGLISTRGDIWSKRRTVLSGHFLSPPALRSYAPAMADDARHMAADLLDKISPTSHDDVVRGATGSRPHDMMHDWLMPFVLRQSLRLTCGVLPDDLDLHQLMADLDVVFGEFNNRSFKPLNILRPTTAAHKVALARVRRVIDAVVAETRRRMVNGVGSENGRPTLASLLLDKGAHVYDTDDAVRDETLLVTFAAYETTAATAAYTLHLLATHPDAQARVRDEVRAVTSGAGTPGRLAPGMATPWLDACVSESMRLYPAAFAVSRRAEVDLCVEATTPTAETEPCVVHVPAGTRIIINSIGISRSPRHWAQPDMFRPERWIESDITGNVEGDQRADERIACATSIPFGAGPRACPGNKLALLEVRTVIAALVSAIEFEPDSALPFTCGVRFMLRPNGPHLLCKPAAATDKAA
ncbi:Cytochrome P450 [Pandoravirus neocaledonia]|uniref:Cytochrome P450 n=1 Tax=Pandoravirus neocaledonia TaxID=2107708 RepID=A0A2U7UC46_9VIRU|nr:Cytochrome P450 [Pandoravirus neocaledonia]AVK76014.1 Cytochrome P450 [Pandoravirus neocaledonia]